MRETLCAILRENRKLINHNMKPLKFIFLFYLILTRLLLFSQIKSNNNNIWTAKEFSKDVSLYNSKQFVFQSVLGISSDVLQFEIIPLAAASSGELTTLLYKCDEKQKEGLVLGFYGDYWNEAGILYQGYSFKNFEKNEAVAFLNKIQSAIDDNNKFIKSNLDYNNIAFKYDDIDVLIYSGMQTYTIRLFWKGFDSTWEKTAFERSKKRFEKKIK